MQHINVNLKSATQLTSMILPQMNKRKKGLIIYLSSGSSTQPTPMQSSYAGKIFSFSKEQKKMPEINCECLEKVFTKLQ